jgi:hypothetical protein
VCVEISERINASPRLLSNHASLVQRRARKQAADRSGGLLLTRAALYPCSSLFPGRTEHR